MKQTYDVNVKAFTALTSRHRSKRNCPYPIPLPKR